MTTLQLNFIKGGLCLLMGLGMYACDSDSSSPQAITPNPQNQSKGHITLSDTQQQMVGQGNTFSFNLFKEVCQNDTSSVFLSPLSASMALAMTNNGAKGATAQEIIDMLGFNSYGMAEVNAYLQLLNDSLPLIDTSTNVKIANSIWLEKTFSYKTAFVETNKRFYQAEVRTLDFKDSQSLGIMNGWCDEKTNHKITKILDEISPDAVMFLMNALYFKGQWAHPFKESLTQEAPFYASDGTSKNVEMMAQTKEFRYTAQEHFDMVDLPYGNGAYSMQILLPHSGIPVDKIVNELNVTDYQKWIESLHYENIYLKLPKFKLEYDRTLNNDLMALGMKTAFDRLKADFGLLTDEQVYISFVKQKTYIDVNEEGTEAAAVTVVGIEKTTAMPSQPVSFVADHPFVLFIRENSTNAILFMGKMVSL